MKALLQRVLYANVKTNGTVVGQIDHGLLIFLGVQKKDKTENADFLSKKICNLRIFEDENGKMNKSILDIKGEILVISQFTLCGDTSRGNRPGFEDAALKNDAKNLYEYFCSALQKFDIKVQQGVFGADMKVEILNDGPVTFMLENQDKD